MTLFLLGMAAGIFLTTLFFRGNMRALQTDLEFFKNKALRKEEENIALWNEIGRKHSPNMKLLDEALKSKSGNILEFKRRNHKK